MSIKSNLNILALIFLPVLLVNNILADTVINNTDAEPTKPKYVQDDQLTIKPEVTEKVKPLFEPEVSKEDLIDALKKEDPKKVENLLATSIQKLNLEGIEILLPAYKEYKQKDKSLEDWGQALIDENKGEYKKSLTKLNEISKKLPDVVLIKFHIALIKYKNNKYNAAKKDFDNIKHDKRLNPAYLKSIESLLVNIKNRNKGNISGSINYLQNDNLSNSPKEGTVLGNGFKAGPREKGNGIASSVNLSRRLHFDSGMYTDAKLGLYNNFYWNNKKYSSLTVRGAIGLGYKDARSDFSIEPFLSKMYYGGGGSYKTEYKRYYRKNYGANLRSNFNLGRATSFSNSLGFTQNEYIKKFSKNDSFDFSINNSLIYNYYSSRFVLGYDYFARDSVTSSDSFARNGVRLGWNKNWYNHIVTLSRVGYGYKKYADEDFFGKLKKNNEYSAGVSVYSPHIQLFGIMPSVNWNYSKTVSNTDSENSSGHSFNFDIGKNF